METVDSYSQVSLTAPAMKPTSTCDLSGHLDAHGGSLENFSQLWGDMLWSCQEAAHMGQVGTCPPSAVKARPLWVTATDSNDPC